MGIESGPTYENKLKSDIINDVEKEFSAIEEKEENWLVHYRDDQQIYAAGMNVIDSYIKKLTNAKNMRVSNEKWGVREGQATLISSENIFKSEAITYFKEQRNIFQNRWTAVLKEKGVCNAYITSSEENKNQINEVASKIDAAENEALKKIKLVCNPKQENVNAEEQSSIVRDSQGNVKVNNGEIERQKPMFNTDRKTGVMTLTDRCNSLTIDKALAGLFKKDDIVYEIDYTYCTNQKIKNKMMEFTGGEVKCLITRDKEKRTYLIRNKYGDTLENRALIWEGVKLKRDEFKQWEAREKKKSQNAQLGHIDAKIDDSMTPENDPELQKFVEKIPNELRDKLRALGNTEYRRFIIETENRLNVILKQGKAEHYELQTEPVSKLYSSGLMEVHFINGYTEKDVKVWEDESILGEKLYGLLDDNEDDYKTYLTTRVQEKWAEFEDLTQIEEINLQRKGDEELIDTDSKSGILYGLGLLEIMITKYRGSEGDSWMDNDDRDLAEIEKILRDGKYSIANATEAGKQAIIEKIINPVRQKWCTIKNIQKTIHTDTGPYENPNYEKQYNYLKDVFFGTKEEQKLGIRELGGYGRLWDNTETSFLADEIAASEIEVNEDGTLSVTGGLEVNDNDLNKCLEKIKTGLFVDLEYDDASGKLKENGKTKLIDDLYEAASGDKSGGKIVQKLIENGMIPKNWENNSDVKEKAKEITIILNKQMNIINSYTVENIKEGEARRKLALEMKSDKTEDEIKQLQALNYLEHHPEEAIALHEKTLQKTKDEIKYGGINNIVLKALASVFVEEGGGAKGANADIYNDIVGYGFWNLSDDNAKVMGEILVEIAITVAIAVVTGGAGAAAMAVMLRGLAVAARGARWVNLATKIVKLVEIGQKGYKGLSVGAKAVKLGYRSTSLLLEGTIFNAASNVVHSAVNGTSLDTLNLNPIEKENIQTAAFLGALSVGNQLAGVMMKVGGRTKVGIDILKGLEKAHLKSPTAWTTSVVTELGTMLASEQVINITFGHDVIDPETGEVHTERTLVPPTQEELCQTIGMILAFKAVKPQLWSKYEQKISDGTLEVCRSVKKNEVLIRDLKTGKVEKIQDLIDGRYDGYKPTAEQKRLHNQNEWLEKQSKYEKEYNQVKDIISQLPENLRSESMKRLLEATDMVEVSPNDIKRIQREIGLTGEDINGVIGPKTLTKFVEYASSKTRGSREVLNEENDILRITEILNKGNVITIDGVKYQFNGIKNGKAEFIIDKDAKKTAEQSGRDLPEQIEVTSLEELLDARFNLEPGVHENNSSRYKKLQELINHEPIVAVNESELGDLYNSRAREKIELIRPIEVKGGKENALEDVRIIKENLKKQLDNLEESQCPQNIKKIIIDKMELLEKEIIDGKEIAEIDFDPENGTFRAFGGFEKFVENLIGRGNMDQNFLNNIKLTIDYMTKRIINVGESEPITLKEWESRMDIGEDFIKEMEGHMVNQWLDNPQYFNSHGFDHTILVHSLIIKVRNGLELSTDMVAKKYGLSQEKAEKLYNGLIELSAALHDLGYPKQSQNGWEKTTHATSGAELFYKELKPKFEEFITKEIGLDVEVAGDLACDMYNAVCFHGADKVESHYVSRVEGMDSEGRLYGGTLVPRSGVINGESIRGNLDFQDFRISYKSEGFREGMPGRYTGVYNGKLVEFQSSNGKERKIVQKEGKKGKLKKLDLKEYEDVPVDDVKASVQERQNQSKITAFNQAIELSKNWGSDIKIYTKEGGNPIEFKRIVDGEKIKFERKIGENKTESVEDFIKENDILRIEGGGNHKIEINVENLLAINEQALNQSLGWLCDLEIKTDKGDIRYNKGNGTYTDKNSGKVITHEELLNGYKIYEITAEVRGESGEIKKGKSITINDNAYEGRFLNNDGTGLEYRSRDLMDDPLMSMIRIADNLDMAFNRLIPSQSNSIFLTALYNLENGGEIATLFQKMKKFNDRKKGELKDEQPPTEQEIRELFEKQLNIDIYKIFEEKGHETNEGWENGKKQITKTFDFTKYYKDGKFDLGKFKQDLFNTIRESGVIKTGYSDETLDMSHDLMNEGKVNSYSVRHMVGLRPIENVDFKDGSVEIKIDMDIYFNSDITNRIVNEDGKHIRLVEYHLWREGTALKAVPLNGKNIKSYVVDKDGKRIGEIDEKGVIDYRLMFEEGTVTAKDDGTFDYSKGIIKSEYKEYKDSPIFKNRTGEGDKEI